VRRAARACGRAARFSFRDLCGGAAGAACFSALADNFDSLLLDGVPALAGAGDDALRRFVVLVDVLYDRRRALVLAPDACNCLRFGFVGASTRAGPGIKDLRILQPGYALDGNDTFVVTGDIAAMWLRDSTNEVLPYMQFAAADAPQRVLALAPGQLPALLQRSPTPPCTLGQALALQQADWASSLFTPLLATAHAGMKLSAAGFCMTLACDGNWLMGLCGLIHQSVEVCACFACCENLHDKLLYVKAYAY
jgi:hypothetical protein